MNLKSCPECGLVYDIDNVKLPTEEQIEEAYDTGNSNGILEWSEEKYAVVPVFKCHCGEFISV